MSSYIDVRDSFKALEPFERKLVLIDLLFEGSIDYIEISNAYANVLEESREQQNKQINQFGMRLGAAWSHIPDNQEFTKAAAAFILVDSGSFKGAQVEEEYRRYLASHPFELSEQGMPKTTLKDAHLRNRKTKELL